MTKAEEQNMWKRLVALETKVSEAERATPRIEETPSVREPPRDRYGKEAGRPDM